MRLAAAALHTLLGCPEACHAHVRALDIKHIQLDSVASHMLIPALVAYTAHMDSGSPQVSTASGSPLQRLLRETTTLFADHIKDAGDTIAMGFTNGNYSQV
jgi:N-terminal acetyltransferase B complex non-catalytic subunit